jgi:hypothetical protein
MGSPSLDGTAVFLARLRRLRQASISYLVGLALDEKCTVHQLGLSKYVGS